MKKITLFLFAMFCSALSFAALNPYAYGLSSTLSLDESTLIVNYSLNADATGVNIVILNGETVVETIPCDGKTKGSYTIEIPTASFPKSTSLTWKVEVLGNSVATPTKQTTTFSFYLPYSMDVDVDTESDYFGRWYVIEATNGGKGKSGYHSTSIGRGLYAFDAALEPIKNNNGTCGFTGGMTLSANTTNAAGDYINLACVTTSGGRVFVGRYEPGLAPILEATDLHSNDYPLVLRSGGGRAIALDARGRGENLQLVMLDTDFNIKEYDLGTAEEWTTAATPSRTFNKTGLIIDRNDAAITYDNEGGLWINQHSASNPTIAHLSTSGLDYDNITAGLSHILGDAKYNIRGAAINQEGTELAVPAAGRGKVAVFTISKDSEGKISLTQKYTVTTGNNNTALSYDYAGNLYIANRSAETISFYAMPYDGEVTTPAPSKYAFELTEVVPSVYTLTTNVVGEGTINGNAGSYVEGSIATLTATPNEHYEFVNWTGDVTSTDNPLTVTVNSNMTITANFAKKNYTLTVFVNDENKGTIDVATGSHVAGTEVTLTATPKPGYKLLYWSDRSTENPRTITMSKNEALSAYFVKEYSEEPTFTIEKIWENTNVPNATADGYQAVGWDEKIYMQNKTAGKIQVFTNGTDAPIDYATSGTGQQIAVDEAGNLIVFNAYFATATPNAVLIYKNGSTEGTAVSFNLQSPARCDFFSASGDIFSPEGGYVYFYCAGKTVINRLKITNGAATAADVTTDVVGESVYSSPQNTNYVMVDIFGNLVAHARSNAINAINVYTNETKSFTLPSIKMGTLGGCSFELGGKEFWAYHAGATNYSSEWNLYNMTDSKFLSDTVLYVVDKTNSTNNACNWLNVQVVDEKTAYIYQFCPKKAAAVWKVTAKETFTVATSANTAEWGTVSGADKYLEGNTATLTATPNTGYKFVNWTENGIEVSTDATYSFTVTKDVTLVANFEALAQYHINAHAEHTSKGYVTGSGDYYEGTEVVLKATAKSGYYFTQWQDGNTENPRTITVNGDAEYIAEFAEAHPRVYAYDLNVVDNGNETYTFSFKPNADAVSGNLLLYSEDGVSVVQTYAISTAIVANTAITITLNKTDLPNQSNIPWAIELSGNAIPAFAETFADSDYRFARAHAVVDNSPESEYFGRVYVADRRKTKSNSKVYVYNPDFTDFTNTNLGLATAGYSRPAVGADGTLYLTGYTDGAEAGIFVVDPADLTKCTQFFNGTYDSDGLYKNNGKEIGSSTSGVGVYGSGKDAVLYTMMEDGSNANFNSGKQPIVCYQIGQANGTVLKQWSEAPTWWVNYPATGKDSYNFGNNDFAATAKGVWVSQNKSNPDDRPEIAFVDKTGTIQFMQNSKPSLGGGMTVNADNTVLYIVEDSKILEYAITWNENKPSLTLSNTYPISLANVSTLSMDYAGNLIACAGVSYSTTDENKMKVVRFTLPTNDNHSIVPAAKAKSVKLGKRYTVTVVVNDENMGEAIGGGSYKEGETATIAASAKANHRFVKWTKGGEYVSNVDSYSFEVTEDVTYTANFEPIPQYTISAEPNDPIMGTVSGASTYYEGDDVTLKATANAGYVFVKWSDDVTDESRTFTASENLNLTAIFKIATPRAWAYDLNMVEDGDDYKFTFTPTSAGNATILFTDKDGTPVSPTQEVVGAVTAGEPKTVSVAKSQFTGTKDIYWSVKVESEAITKMAEITDPTKGIYDIVAPQGIAVDNNTESDYFGQVYVAAATDGTVARGAQTRGVFVYNPILNELNAPNIGYLPANVTLTNTTRQAIHRVAVSPTSGQVAFAYNISGSTAVWEMNPENLAGDAVNMIEGSEITKANSLCYDAEGALYVMDNANTTTGGKIYKIQDGVASVFAEAQTGCYWATEENAMTPDGRGGLWIAQNRWQVDTYPALSHVNKDGIVDFAVTTSSPEELKALFPHDDNNASYRGQCAYYVADDILAFAGNKEAVLFKITYDANNVPTNLEKLLSTGKLGTNIDGVAFDYAGDLYVASETTKRFYKFVVPTNDNTCTVPAPKSQFIQKEARYTVTVEAYDAAMGTVSGGGEFLAGETITLTATANADYRFVNWTNGTEVISTDANFTYTVPAENVTIVAKFELKPLEMVGTVKRAVQIDDATIVLTHESNGTAHIYNVVNGEVKNELSQSSVVPVDTENAGDMLAISDIAATDDGKLVAINKIVCQASDDQVDAGYKRGETKVYLWNDLAADPTLWFTSKMSSNWFRSVQGHTMAFKGTSTNGTLFTTGVTATGVKFRYSVYNVIDGVYTEPAVNDSEHYHFTKGDAQTTDNLGANYEINASPLASENWILDGGNVDPFEITDPLTYNSQVTAGSTITEDLGKKYNGATYLTIQGVNLMVAPYADGEKVGGVTVLNISGGLNKATELAYQALGSSITATAAATAVKVNGNELLVTLVTDNKVQTLPITVELPIHTRVVPAGYYATVCLPYNLVKVTGATLYEVAGRDNDKVYLDEVPASETQAGKPYIFYTDAATQVFYYGDQTAAAGYHNSLHGTFTEMKDDELDGMYMLQSNKIVKCAATGCWIDPYRAYFNGTELEALGKPGAQMPGRRRVSLGATVENTTTGSEDILTPNDQVIKVIENGQVIIIRNGVKYNAQGQRL